MLQNHLGPLAADADAGGHALLQLGEVQMQELFKRASSLDPTLTHYTLSVRSKTVVHFLVSEMVEDPYGPTQFREVWTEEVPYIHVARKTASFSLCPECKWSHPSLL